MKITYSQTSFDKMGTTTSRNWTMPIVWFLMPGTVIRDIIFCITNYEWNSGGITVKFSKSSSHSSSIGRDRLDRAGQTNWCYVLIIYQWSFQLKSAPLIQFRNKLARTCLHQCNIVQKLWRTNIIRMRHHFGHGKNIFFEGFHERQMFSCLGDKESSHRWLNNA